MWMKIRRKDRGKRRGKWGGEGGGAMERCREHMMCSLFLY